MTKEWEEFEEHVREVYNVLLKLENENILVTRDATLIGRRSGTLHQIDVFYELERARIRHRVAIECKYKIRPVEKSDVSNFYGVIQDIGNVIGVMVSKVGYQSGAEQFAEAHNILPLTLADLPDIGTLLGKLVEKYFLPDEKSIGEPFWVIMELSKNGQINGNYFASAGSYLFKGRSKPAIPLFFSKKHAQFTLDNFKIDKKRWAVRGLPQHILKGLILFAYVNKWKLIVCPYEPDPATGKFFGLDTSAEKIAEDYFLDKISFKEFKSNS